MRLRSVLVVLSLLALVAGPADAAKQSRSARQKKAAAMKRAQAARQKKVKPQTGTHQAAGTLGGTRTGAKATEGKLPREEAVAQSGSRTPKKNVRTQSRAGVTAQQHRRDTGAIPTSIASARTFDSSAAVGPRKKSGRVKRWVAGLFLAAAVAVGGYGWHATDMNSKVGDAWTYIQHVVSDATHPGGGGGGGHTTPIPPVPDPGPQPPFPDPGPPTPPGPDNQTPGPSGGHGHQTPHHPETDHRGG